MDHATDSADDSAAETVKRREEVDSSTELTSFVGAFRDGDAAATRAVRQRVRRILAFRGFRMAYEDRLDLEQTVMMQLWGVARRAEFEVSGFWGLVEVITARRCVDWIRSRRPEVGVDAIFDVPDVRSRPQRDLLDNERRELAAATIRQLSKECRDLVELRIIEDKTYTEIAKELGRSEGALRVQMHRCIKQAHEILRMRLKERHAATE